MKQWQRGSAPGNAIIVALIVFGLGILLLTIIPQNPAEVSEGVGDLPQESAAPAVSGAPSARITPSASLNPEQAQNLSSQCQELLRDLRDLDLKAMVANPSSSVDFPAPAECAAGSVSPELSAVLGNYKMACEAIQAFSDDRLTDEEARKRNHTCLLALATLRGRLAAAESSGIKIANISDPKQLEERLIDALAKRDVNQTLDAARRLLELEPRHRGASRALMNSYLQLAGAYNGTRKDPFWRDVRQAVRQGIRSGNLDRESAIRARLYADYLQYKNANRLIRMADREASEFPEAAAPYLFKALGAYQKKRKAEAIAFLQEYGRRSNDPEASAAVSRLQSGHADPFQFSFLAPVDLLGVFSE